MSAGAFLRRFLPMSGEAVPLHYPWGGGNGTTLIPGWHCRWSGRYGQRPVREHSRSSGVFEIGGVHWYGSCLPTFAGHFVCNDRKRWGRRLSHEDANNAYYGIMNGKSSDFHSQIICASIMVYNIFFIDILFLCAVCYINLSRFIYVICVVVIS